MLRRLLSGKPNDIKHSTIPGMKRWQTSIWGCARTRPMTTAMLPSSKVLLHMYPGNSMTVCAYLNISFRLKDKICFKYETIFIFQKSFGSQFVLSWQTQQIPQTLHQKPNSRH